MGDRAAAGDAVEAAAFASHPPRARAILKERERGAVGEAVGDGEHVRAALADLHEPAVRGRRPDAAFAVFVEFVDAIARLDGRQFHGRGLPGGIRDGEPPRRACRPHAAAPVAQLRAHARPRAHRRRLGIAPQQFLDLRRPLHGHRRGVADRTP